MDKLHFHHVIAVDFEFSQPDGETPRPVCLVAKDLRTRQTWRLFGEELTGQPEPPYPIGDDAVIVAYYASAEIGCHLVLGWDLPVHVLDLFTEFRCASNGLPPAPGGSGLLGALTWHGLEAIEAAEKDSMRQLAIRGGPYTEEERVALLEYCESDVLALERLLPRMFPTLDLPRALLRGRYMKAAARIEANGIPIDVVALQKLRQHWEGIQDELIKAIDRDYGVFDGRTLSHPLIYARPNTAVKVRCPSSISPKRCTSGRSRSSGIVGISS